MRKDKNLKVMFTSVGRRVELIQRFKAAAERIGIRLEIIGVDIVETAPALAFCDKMVIVPRISSPDYIPTLLQLCEKFQIDAVIPTIDTDLYLLSCEKQKFTELGTTLVVSAPDKIAICRDKRRTADYFHSVGLSSPTPVDDIKQYTGGFPAFIKPVDGSSSKGANKANTMEELQFFADQLPNYIIQPFVSGLEYTVDIFCDFDGNPIYITPRVRRAVRAGEVLKTEICHDKSIIGEMLRLIEDFKPCGAITVQLIQDVETRENQYIEINPRFGGGAPLTMKAGAKAAEALLRLLMGEELSFDPFVAEEGAVYSRFDQSICVNRVKSPPVTAVVFDLDDTLYSEKEYVRSGYRQVAALLTGVENAEEQLWEAFERGEPAIDAVLRANGMYSEAKKQECLKAYRYQQPQISLYEGVPELFKELREAGIKIGVITDGRPEGQRAKLQALGLADMVDSILITDELGGAQFRKPNDIAFRVMQLRLGVPFEEIVYVGDNASKDFAAPRALEMQWIHYCNPDGLYNRVNISDGLRAASIPELTDLLCNMI